MAGISEQYSFEELQFAAQKSKRRSFSESYESSSCGLTPSEALALYLDLDLSDRKYIVLRQKINSLHTNCLPSLHALRREKQSIIPPIIADEFSTEVELKCLMRKTVEGIAELCDVQNITENEKLSLICKWGMDGSSGHSRYKQKFDNPDHSDEFMFLIAFVPLK